MSMALQSSAWINVMRWGYTMKDNNLDLETYRFHVMTKSSIEL